MFEAEAFELINTLFFSIISHCESKYCHFQTQKKNRLRKIRYRSKRKARLVLRNHAVTTKQSETQQMEQIHVFFNHSKTGKSTKRGTTMKRTRRRKVLPCRGPCFRCLPLRYHHRPHLRLRHQLLRWCCWWPLQGVKRQGGKHRVS